MDRGALPLNLGEVRDWLRLGTGDGDARAAALIRVAADLCEAFTGQMLLVRGVVEERDAAAGWMPLLRRPLVAVDGVDALGAAGAGTPLPADAWDVRGDGGGGAAAAVRLHGALPPRIRIRYRAGLADHGAALPDALRHGLMRLVQHLHDDRADAGGDGAVAVPAIVAALWLPWRRVSLGGGGR